MIGIRVILVCQIVFLGLILSGYSVEGYWSVGACRDREYWCPFLVGDLQQCRKYPSIANICKLTCAKCGPRFIKSVPECTTNPNRGCPKDRPICRNGKCFGCKTDGDCPHGTKCITPICEPWCGDWPCF